MVWSLTGSRPNPMPLPAHTSKRAATEQDRMLVHGDNAFALGPSSSGHGINTDIGQRPYGTGNVEIETCL